MISGLGASDPIVRDFGASALPLNFASKKRRISMILGLGASDPRLPTWILTLSICDCFEFQMKS